MASPAEKQEKTGNQDKKAEEPAAGKDNTGTEQDGPQDSKVPPSIAAVPGHEAPENGSSADARSMGLEDKEIERHSLFAASKEATSPDGKWMVVWENGQLMLYGVNDTEQTKLQTLAFADRPEEPDLVIGQQPAGGEGADGGRPAADPIRCIFERTDGSGCR